MNFISLCSGIEAASVAFGPLGWKAIAFSEIEGFPSAVLAHHYPTVRNYGDMSLFRDWPDELFADADAIVGGPPCQAFSVAGARRGLLDARGNLTLIYVELLDHADDIRRKYGKPPIVALYENVPGIFSDRTNAFGCLVGGLAGEDVPVVPPGKRWTDAGCVFGPERAVAWRLFDAQFFGLAQRRRRVFVVASARKGFDPATVLFEWDGVRRDTAPSREARETAPTIPARSTAGGGLGTDFDCDGGVIQVCPTLRAGGNRTGGDIPPGTDVDTADSLIPVAYGGNNQSGPIDVATARNACASASGRMDFETETFLVQPTHTLRGEGFDASEDGTGRGTPLVPVAFHPTQDPISSTDGTTHALGCGSSGGQASVAVAIQDVRGTDKAQNGRGWNDEGTAYTLDTHATQGVAYSTKLHNTGSNNAGKIFEERTTCLDANSPPPALLTAMQVRRLTPTEAERLMGFPDGYTAIPWRGKPADQCPDGPRYRALGNSWAIPVVRWIGERIAAAVAQRCAKSASHQPTPATRGQWSFTHSPACGAFLRPKDPAMNEHVHPVMTEALRGHLPPAWQEPTEAQRLAADLYNMQHKERIYQERALALQIRHGSD